MARDLIDMTPIETRDELVAWFEAGSKPRAQFRVGTEHEKFAFTVTDHRPVPYEGPRSIRALLEGMHDLLGWEPIMEGDNIIGMSARRQFGVMPMPRKPMPSGPATSRSCARCAISSAAV